MPCRDIQQLAPQKTRRRFLAGAGAALAAPAILIPGRARASDSLVVAHWGGSTGLAKKKAFYDPFTRETGIPITQVAGPDLAKIAAQVKNKDVELDVVDVLESWVPTGERNGLFERLDETIIPMKEVIPAARREYVIGGSIWGGGIAFPTDRFQDDQAPRNWVDFFDAKRFPGRRGLRSRPGETLELALLADGVPPEKVYPMDVERAFRALERVKPAVSHWISQTPLSISLLQSNECDFTYTYLGRVLDARKAGLPLNCRLSPILVGISWFAVIRGTRRKDAAMRFVEFALRPDRQLELANITGYAPVRQGVRERIDESLRPWVPDPEAPSNLVLDTMWWDGRQEELDQRFKRWLIT